MTSHDASQIEPYTLLRTALAMFKKSPTDLEAQQLQQVTVQARNEFMLENRVLNSAEAVHVIISDEQLGRAYAEVRSRFESDTDFVAAMFANALDEARLKKALFRQCKVDAVMEHVASRSPKVDEVEIGIFYHSHPEKFHLPERRRARHILISINPDYPENTRTKARQRLASIADTLKRKPHKFPDLALKHSECPTALNGGNLGAMTPGQLYPALDTALFKLKLNEISDILESEVGFHLLQCQQIIAAETLSLQKASPKIRQIIQERYRQNYLRTWLASLTKIDA